MPKYKISFIRDCYKREYAARKEIFLDAIDSCLSRGALTLQDEVVKLEQKLAQFSGTKYAITVGSGTDALFLSLLACGIGKGDAVLVPSYTFIASLQAIHHTGAEPVLVDVNEDDELMNLDQVEEILKTRKDIKAIMPVHLCGKVVTMRRLMSLAKKYKLKVIEDAAQAIGATQNGKKAGSWGDTGCYSFNTAKLLGAYGDGGAVVTNNRKLAETVGLLRNHWNLAQLSVVREDYPPPKTIHWAWKSRLDNIQAAVLLEKLKYLPWTLKRRERVALKYNKAFADLPVHLPKHVPGCTWQEYHLRIQARKRNDFVLFLKKRGIETLVRDKTPNHKLKGLGLDHYSLPVTEKLCTEVVRLPKHAWLRDDEIEYVIENVRAYFFGK